MKTKTDNLKYKLLCQQRHRDGGMDFCTDRLHNEWGGARDRGAVPATVLAGTHTGLGWQRRMLKAIKIGLRVARKREAFWEARFTVAVANCNARMPLPRRQ